MTQYLDTEPFIYTTDTGEKIIITFGKQQENKKRRSRDFVKIKRKKRRNSNSTIPELDNSNSDELMPLNQADPYYKEEYNNHQNNTMGK